MRERRIKAREKARARERAAAAAPASDPSPPDRPWRAVGLIVLAGVVVAVLIGFVWSQEAKDAALSAACTVTGCRTGAMAVVGYVTVLIPFGYGAAVRWRWDEGLEGNWIAWALCGAASLIIATLVFSNGDSPAGPAADAFGHGATWAVGAFVVTGVLVGFTAIISIKIDRELGSRALLTLATFLLGSCGIAAAVTVPAPNYLLTTQIFPEPTIAAQGDVLTRVSATDLVGCGGRWDGCSRTAEFEYSTSDSDAVTRLEIVSFPDNDAAWDAWGAVREPRDPAALQEVNVTDQWLLLSTVRHADGRAIAAGDKKWLRWPAKQLEWAFRDAIGYSLTYPPEASETVAPRTP